MMAISGDRVLKAKLHQGYWLGTSFDLPANALFRWDIWLVEILLYRRAPSSLNVVQWTARGRVVLRKLGLPAICFVCMVLCPPHRYFLLAYDSQYPEVKSVESVELGSDEGLDTNKIIARIEKLEKRIESRQNESQHSAQPIAVETARSSDMPTATAPGRSEFKIVEDKEKNQDSASTDKWNVKLGGHIQLDYVTWANADTAISDAENFFNYRRLRLVADGTGYQQFDFRLQMTLEPGDGLNTSLQATPDVKDAYLSMNEIPMIGRFRIGNFFVPFSLEQVTNDTNNIFTERSIPSQNIFAADREVGMAVYNCTTDQSFSWASGIFFHDLSDTIKTRFGDSQGYRVSGRINWIPFYDDACNGRYLIHTGCGVLHTNSLNERLRFRARPQIQRGPILIDSGNLAANSSTTGNLELAIVWGSITLQQEAFLSQVNLTGTGVSHVGGAYSHVSCFLTGENRIYERFGQHGAQFARNKPLRNFSARPGNFSPGAWEAKIRWSWLDLSDTNAGQYNDLTAGFNWYWSDRTRVMFDWIRPYTTDGTVFGSTQSDLIAMRFDVNW